MAGACQSAFGDINAIAQNAAARMFPVLAERAGIDLYGNGILVSQALIRERPQTVARLVRATHKGIRDSVADPDAAIAALARREPLINRDLEKRRLLYPLRTTMLTPEVQANGFGEVFDRRFLPPVAERRWVAK